MADWAAAAAAWAQSGEGEKTQFVPPPQPPPPKVEQQQPGAWGGADQQQAWMPPHQMDHAAAAAAHQGQQQHSYGTVRGGSDLMGGGGHQGFGQEGKSCWEWGVGFSSWFCTILLRLGAYFALQGGKVVLSALQCGLWSGPDRVFPLPARRGDGGWVDSNAMYA